MRSDEPTVILNYVSTTYLDAFGALTLTHDVPIGHSLLLFGANSLGYLPLLNEIGGVLEGSAAGGTDAQFGISGAPSGHQDLNVFCHYWNIIRNLSTGEVVSYIPEGEPVMLIELDGFINGDVFPSYNGSTGFAVPKGASGTSYSGLYNRVPSISFGVLGVQDRASNGLGATSASITSVDWVADGSTVRILGFGDNYALAVDHFYSDPTQATSALQRGVSVAGTGIGDAFVTAIFAFEGVSNKPALLFSNRDGRIHEVYRKSGSPLGLYHRASPLDVPDSFGTETLITFSAGHPNAYMQEPGFVELPGGRLILIYQDTGVVFRWYSDDGGATWLPVTIGGWGSGVLNLYPLVSGSPMDGIHPCIAHDPRTRKTFFAAYNPAPWNGAVDSTVTGALQGPGDDPTVMPTTFLLKDDAGANLVPDDDTFSVAPVPDGPGRWILAGRFGGVTKQYQSTDDGQTWTFMS